MWDKIQSEVNAVISADEIHWFLAQWMSFQRGSAAITEIFIRAIAHSCGIKLGPLKSLIMPDLESFITPIQEFAQKYSSFYK